MSEWQRSSLDEIAYVNPSTSLKQGVLAKKVAMDSLKPFTKKIQKFELATFTGGMKFKNGDTLVARITPCLENGKTAYVDILNDDEVAFGSTEYIVLRERTKRSDRQFLYYFATSNIFREVAILSMTGSSGRQRVQTEMVTGHEFEFPSVDEQRAIAGVLVSLDDKIDLLRRQNQTLYALAETLFRHWFIDGAQDDWVPTKLSEVVRTNLKTLRGDHIHSEIQYLDTGSITEGVIESLQRIPLKDAPSRARRLVGHNDIIISTVRPNHKHYGFIKNPPSDLVVSTGFCVVTCESIDPHFVYLFLTQPEMTEYLSMVAEASTSTYPSLKPSDIEALEFLMPPEKLIAEFGELASDSWQKIAANHIQISELKTLRDTLLPKLMSGEVCVEYEVAA